MKRFTVRLRECSSRETAIDKTVKILIPETNEMDDPTDDADAIQKAVEKMFGKTCFWFRDSGLGLYYGQVFHPVSQKYGGGNSSVTCRARIDVTEGW
jgi:hypothetical protein